MNITKILPDDPRLTAYALGELDPAEHTALEAAIKDDPAAQAAVAQIRVLCSDLTTVLAKEPLPFVPTPEKKAAPSPGHEAYEPRKFVRFPFYLIGGLAAACFAVLIVVQERDNARKQYQLAEAKASSEAQQEKMREELAKLEDRNRTLYEVDLREDGEHVVHLPSVAADEPSKPNAPGASIIGAAGGVAKGSDMYAEVVKLDSMKVEATREGFAAAISTNSQQIASPGQPSLAQGNIGSASGGQTWAHKQANGSIDGVPSSAKLASADEGTLALSAFSVEPSTRERKSVEIGVVSMPAPEQVQIPVPSAKAFNTEAYDRVVDNDYLDAVGNPLSTFSIDVDTAGYSNMRRFVQQGRRPPRDSVRIEEMVNYFPYRYIAPKDDKPFAASMEVASAPWNPQHRLVRIGLKGREIPESERPALNLVFLLDVSGSMNEPNKLPLVKDSMRLLVEKLKPTDHVAIVVYAGASGLALPSTAVEKKQEILAAIEELRAGGSTNGAMGIQLAYDIAKANFIKDGANRVVLCTDGDFNVGVTNQGDLTRLIEEKAKSGVFLTVLGFGMGNYKDSTLEKLADKGNGNYGYVDNFAEAKKLLVNQLSGTLVTIAKDVKIQVEFNPAKVKSYRLIGYENRMLKKEDFNNDKIDAGEIGAGHTVTALYEVVPVGVDSPEDMPAVDTLKYQPKEKAKLAKSDGSAEMMTLKVRYKAPTSDVSSKLEFPLVDTGVQFTAASQDFKFAAAVAGFGMMLRESPHKGATTFDAVLGWAEDGLGEDEGGYRHEFIDLVAKAKGISG